MAMRSKISLVSFIKMTRVGNRLPWRHRRRENDRPLNGSIRVILMKQLAKCKEAHSSSSPHLFIYRRNSGGVATASSNTYMRVALVSPYLFAQRCSPAKSALNKCARQNADEKPRQMSCHHRPILGGVPPISSIVLIRFWPHK